METRSPRSSDTDARDQELINLIGRCALRDQAALKLLFERIGPYLNAVAFRILRSDEAAADVLQEAFIQIWNNAGSYRPHLSRPLTWLASIARYRALDKLDSEQRHRQRFKNFGDDDSIESIPGPANPEADVHKLQLNFHLHRCLGTLGDNIRRSIELAYLYGHTREEIAQQFSTNVNTVKSWLHRGAERLKQCLEAL
jgi:RNA polymerase sigma-70 factor, ECF subfamily